MFRIGKPKAESSPKSIGSRISVLHITVIVLSLAMTFGAWKFSKHQIDNRIESRFDAARDRALDLIADRMAKYEDALWAGVSAMESHNSSMTRNQWRMFANTLRIEEKYPGINGIGVIHFVPQTGLAEFLAERRNERPDFSIHPPHEQSIRIPISFIEPEHSNAAAIGLDIAHEVNRRTAALASRDTGRAQITGPIVLVQDAGNTPGFLFYAPFYKNGVPATQEARRDSIMGAVYAPFVVRKLMEGLLAKELRDVRFSIRDGGELIYNEHTSSDPLADPNPMHSQVVTLDLYGRVWSIDLRTNLTFRAANTYDQPTVILVGGLLIEALIVALLILMSRANHHAVSYADKVTAKLREKTDDLAKTNQELEQFAYITSHDLRTPIRGIGGLTEILREDLEDYFNSPNANGEVDRNLTRILDRVARMNDLTQGVMEISKIGKQTQSNQPLSLQEAILALQSDFDLSPQSLSLSGTIQTITTDPFNFRRILENLVSNAIKYHCGENPLRIDVSAHQIGQRIRISVTDNGPGIDAKFHDRIFEVFQTLRCADTPESSGIGLAIVKKTVEHHNGSVTVSSTPGDGACFTFDWPANADHIFSETLKEAA